MNFDRLILPAISIAALYEKSLVEVNEGIYQSPESDIESADKPHYYSFLGSNGKKISFIIFAENRNNDSLVHLPFIIKLLEACKLKLDDVAVLNHFTEPILIKHLTDQLQPGIVILFGVPPTEIGLPLQFPDFKIQSYNNITFLCAPDLSEINADNEKGKLFKSKLWVCLRQVFQF